MEPATRYQRQVGLVTVLSALLALASMALGAIAVEFHLEAFSDPTSILQFARQHAYAKWFLYTDMLGYYLLLLPIAFYLHEYLQRITSWANLLTFCGVGYILTGATGAAILASVWPQQMQEYLTADAVQQAALQREVDNITWIVYGGLWNVLEVLLAGVWWLGVGWALRGEHRSLGTATLVLGIASVLDGLGNMFGFGAVAEPGLNLYLILAIVWAAWAGLLVYRGKI